MEQSPLDFVNSEALVSTRKKKRETNKKNDVDVENYNIDRLSDLPEHIIHHIMSFLPTVDSTHISTLSKSFSSLWRSFPILDFDFYLMESISRYVFTTNTFLDLVTRALERRALKSDLQRLSFRACLNRIHEDESKATLKRMANFAMQNNVKDLFLNIVNSRVRGLPKEVFSCKSIKRMLLGGLQLNSTNLVLSCPLIEDFSIINCTSAGEITINVCSPKLKTAKFENWIGLERILIDGAKSLDSFSYTGAAEQNCEIVNLVSCNSLKTVILKTASITDEWLKNQVSLFVSLEILKLANCKELKNVRILSNSLKIMHLQYCAALENVDVVAPKLEAFRSEGNTWCNIDLTECIRLKDLQLVSVRSANVSKEWSEEKICTSGFQFLENLKLERCELLKEITFYAEHLKHMELLRCENLQAVEIDAPNLVSLVYSGPVLLSSPVISYLQNSEIHLDYLVIPRDNRYYKSLRDLISNFGQCKTLTLACNDYEKLIFPLETRKKMVCPLFDLPHLNIRLENKIPSIVHLIEGLLWLAPHPKTISITVASKVLATFKFYYAPTLKLQEDEHDKIMWCCIFSSIKCWRHDLTRIEMEIVFESFDERASLRSFFMKNAKAPITTCIDKILVSFEENSY